MVQSSLYRHQIRQFSLHNCTLWLIHFFVWFGFIKFNLCYLFSFAKYMKAKAFSCKKLAIHMVFYRFHEPQAPFSNWFNMVDEATKREKKTASSWLNSEKCQQQQKWRNEVTWCESHYVLHNLLRKRFIYLKHWHKCVLEINVCRQWHQWNSKHDSAVEIAFKIIRRKTREKWN